jgi:hypothetical protein
MVSPLKQCLTRDEWIEVEEWDAPPQLEAEARRLLQTLRNTLPYGATVICRATREGEEHRRIRVEVRGDGFEFIESEVSSHGAWALTKTVGRIKRQVKRWRTDRFPISR